MPTKAESTTSSKISSTGQHRAPQRLPLAHVVGQQRHPPAAALELAHQLDHRLVRVQRVEVDLAEAVQLGSVAELGLERVREPVEEVRLGDLARVSSSNSGCSPSRSATACIARPSASTEIPVSSWKAANELDQRRRQHAAEVGDRRPRSRRPHARVDQVEDAAAALAAQLDDRRDPRRRPPSFDREIAPTTPDARIAAAPPPVELEPDPAQLAVGAVLGREQGLVELLEARRGRRSRPATSSSPCPSAPAGRSAASASSRPSPRRAESTADALDLVPVELAARAPRAAGLRGSRVELGEPRRRPTRSCSRSPRRRLELERDALTHRSSPGVELGGRSVDLVGACPRSRSPGRPAAAWPAGPVAAGRGPRPPAPESIVQPTETRRCASRATTPRKSARVGGISSSEAEDVGDEPGGEQQRAAEDDHAPSKTSRAGTRPSASAAVEAPPGRPSLRARQRRAERSRRGSGARASARRRSPRRPG